MVMHLLKGCAACARTLRALMEPVPVARADYEKPLDRFDEGLLQGMQTSIHPMEAVRHLPRGVLLESSRKDGPRKKQ